MVSAQARLEQVRCAVQRGLSQRRACALMGAARSGLHYELRMPAKDAPVIEAMKDLSGQFPAVGDEGQGHDSRSRLRAVLSIFAHVHVLYHSSDPPSPNRLNRLVNKLNTDTYKLTVAIT